MLSPAATAIMGTRTGVEILIERITLIWDSDQKRTLCKKAGSRSRPGKLERPPADTTPREGAAFLEFNTKGTKKQ